MKLMTPEKNGRLVLDFDDIVQRSMTVVRYSDGVGALTWPPPPVQVSATPTPTPAVKTSAKAERTANQRMSPRRRFESVGVAAALLFLVAALSPPALLGHLTVCSRWRS